MDYKSFDTLNDTFNIDNDIENIDDNVEEVEVTEDKPKNKKKAQKYTLEDLEYLKTELQDRIENNRIVANELAQTLKVGAPPRLYEVYAKLSTTISDDIMHLADISRQITDYQVIEAKEKLRKDELEFKKAQQEKKALASINKSPQNLTQIQNNYNTITMGSKDLLDKVISEVGDNADVITDPNQLPKYNFD